MQNPHAVFGGREHGRTSFRYLSNLTGLSLLAQQIIALISFLAATAVYLLVRVFVYHAAPGGFSLNFTDDPGVLPNALYLFVYITYMFIPFVLIAFLMRQHPSEAVPFGRIGEKRAVLPAVFIALGLSVIASFVTDIIQSILALFHLQAVSAEFAAPSEPAAFAVYILEICLVAPFLEELLFRGIILSNLRKYGNGFAIILSSLLFAIIHGNLVQIPLAFLEGLVLSYFVLRLGSIWISVLMHVCVNLFSVAIDSLGSSLPAQALNIAGPVLVLLTFALCTGSAYYLFRKGERGQLLYSDSEPMGHVLVKFITTPGMIAFLVFSVFQIFFLNIKIG